MGFYNTGTALEAHGNKIVTTDPNSFRSGGTTLCDVKTDGEDGIRDFPG